ncbi:MAG: hydroxymethylbilane synthase [Magnetococcales bacterium]|nr:hydroxymethylbilane synthase [Magnetococcales bacterium]
METLRIGTRGSALALWQANWVKSRLLELNPELTVELVIIKTKGDKILDVPLAKVGGKGLFVKELEEAMLDGRADIAVHSMKDVPAEFPEGLTLGPILERADPRDVFLSTTHDSIQALPQGAKVGSSSLRRQSQLLNQRPDLQVIPLRGNVNTRIGKLVAGEFDGIILAAAGVIRLEMTEHVKEYLDPTVMIPANGQGAVGIELRVNDPRVEKLIAPLDHPETRIRVLAERSFLATLEGGCQVPIAGYATLADGRLKLVGRVASLDGKRYVTLEREGQADDQAAVVLGKQLGEALLSGGGREILAEIMPEIS